MHALHNRNILVTRPNGLEAGLMQLLISAGARPHHVPAIDIVAPSDDASRIYARDHFDEFDIAIFISPTAVTQTLNFMSIDDSRCAIAAIGSRSQRALEEAGLKLGIKPEGHDSESLLALAALQQNMVNGKRIVILRGQDGRDILAEQLAARGAKVTYAAMYNRVRPDVSLPCDLIESLDAITISSNEGLQNIYDLVQEHTSDVTALLDTCLFVPGKRAHGLASTLGFNSVFIADNATDQAMYDALVNNIDKCV